MEKVKLAEGVWNVIPGGMSAAYLVVGENRALLVDSGAGEADVKAVCAEITDLPIELVNTHYHADHTACNKDFGRFCMHPADIRLFKGDWKQITPVAEGYVFDLGGRTVEVIDTPGHTPGSISLYDKKSNIIFTGDSVGKKPIFLCKGDYDLDEFRSSMIKLKKYDADMYGAHDQTLNRTDTIDKLIEAVDLFQTGKIEGKRFETDFIKATVYMAPNGTGFFVP